MYDISSKFNVFYESYVILPQCRQSELLKKKDLNIQRLKDGLKEYNTEHGTDYKVVNTCVQGSVAMSTVVQNQDSDYDIDVAVVFDKEALGEKGALATRNMIADALRRKTKQFNAEPEVKTSCVRIEYADGYHMDFAIYRRYYNKRKNGWVYEHAGSEWTERELTGLTDWFKIQNNESNGKLRKIVRLSKMFCKSRESWKDMPSGLLQTVLCDEKIQTRYERLDELFYYTMHEVVKRLENNTTVLAPVDNGRDLTPRNSDARKMMNWRNRLKSKLEDLEVLFKNDCSEDDALQAWYGFFNHEYWKKILTEKCECSMNARELKTFGDTEQFIEDLYPVNCVYGCSFSCMVSADGFRPKSISEFLRGSNRFLPHNFKIQCAMTYTTCPQPYRILWKVKNVGPEAERRNRIRGQICDRGRTIVENSCFYGNHYIECYIVKEDVCVARHRVDVPIGR